MDIRSPSSSQTPTTHVISPNSVQITHSPNLTSSTDPVDSLAKPHTTRQRSEVEELPKDFLSPDASAEDNLSDVDWPEADQDMVSSPISPTRSSVTRSHTAAGLTSTGNPRRSSTMTVNPMRVRDGFVSPNMSTSPPTNTNSSTMDEPILFHLLSKQVRSEYFNMELILFSTLHDLSAGLAKVPPLDRNKVLREQLTLIDRDMIRGLYFPLIPHSLMQDCAGAHYKILRVLPEECWSLASRDKAPFLMHIEIAYAEADKDGKRMSCFDPLVYTAYRSNDEIMKDALAGMTVSSARASRPLENGDGDGMQIDAHTPQTPAEVAAARAEKIAALAGTAAVAAAASSDKSATVPMSVDTTWDGTMMNDRLMPSPLVSSPLMSSGSVLSTVASMPTSPHTSDGTSNGAILPGASSTLPKPTRTVPAPNPFRPRRSTTYQTGPTLCDIDFPILYGAFGESFLAKKNRIRASSPFTQTVGPERWDLVSVIFKGGDDLRQEVLAMQFITAFDRIFRAAKLPLWLKPYSVVITSSDSGLIETISDAVSIDSLKKRLYPHGWTCLTDFYAAFWGGCELQSIIEGPDMFATKYPCDTGLVTYQEALRNFVESMASYSLITWLLQIKDRHNGNIMIDRVSRKHKWAIAHVKNDPVCQNLFCSSQYMLMRCVSPVLFIPLQMCVC